MKLPVQSSVSLTPRLEKEVDTGRLKNMERECVIPFLIADLQWRVVDQGDGKDMDKEILPGFEVSVASGYET